MKNFRTYELALKFHEEGRKVKLRGELKDQFERASLSVVLNLQEMGRSLIPDRPACMPVCQHARCFCLKLHPLRRRPKDDFYITW